MFLYKTSAADEAWHWPNMHPAQLVTLYCFHTSRCSQLRKLWFIDLIIIHVTMPVRTLVTGVHSV